MSPRRASPEPVLLVCLCALLAASSAWALSSDKNQPINIHADHGDFKADPKNASNGTGIYTGHVVITQGSIVLQADKAVLRVVNNDLSSADLTGDPATFQQQPDNGEMMQGNAQEITYNASTNEIVLMTRASLTQAVPQVPSGHQAILAPGAPTAIVSPPGERLMTADIIRYNTDTQHVIAKSGDESQRVHVSFPPKIVAPAAGTAAKPVTGRKSLIAPPVNATRAPVTLKAAPQAPAPSSTPAPAAATPPGRIR
ncbi:MAG TPA: lipopolysaccharide transport periplasmic protein LptA [Gammaproteobacteria bacterium]|nr:lipopolysaccharide transport periplasmic protein LptA [Gammaproteobacteria bacterium]